MKMRRVSRVIKLLPCYSSSVIKGGPNEIYRYRQTWKEARGFDRVGVSYQPTEISDPLNRAVLLVKEEIEKEARAEIAELKAHYDAKLKNLEENQQLTQAELLQFIDKHDEITQAFHQEQANVGRKKLLPVPI